MPRFILTGAPGAGKTAVLRWLEAAGSRVVEEAATDVIALAQALGDQEPWRRGDFVDRVVRLQRQRETDSTVPPTEVVFHDRSPVCTLALSRYFGFPTSRRLAEEVDRVTTGGYASIVFFVRNRGEVRPTPARRITFEESLVFERLHQEAYEELGFHLVDVPAGPLRERAHLVRRTALGWAAAAR